MPATPATPPTTQQPPHTPPDPGLLARALACAAASDDLGDPPPADPIPILARWLEEARAQSPDDYNAMALATATTDGLPSVRFVLCKALEAAPPAILFFSNYQSRKGRELDANPRAAAVFYWPRSGRQARVEGTVIRTSAAESDEYFKTRPLVSRIGAIASDQSRPLSSRAELAARLAKAGAPALRPGHTLQRPPHWGGYRLLITRAELWCARDGRLHDRIEWTRDRSSPASHSPAPWTARRLCP